MDEQSSRIPPVSPALREAGQKLVADALRICPDDERLRAAAGRLGQRCRVLFSGLRSVGKSSLVCALWGDAGLLPTAERDCTQTNTLVRVPGNAETDREIFLAYLSREIAAAYMVGGLAFYRIAQMVTETLGPAGPRLDEGTPEARLRAALETMRKIFQSQPSLQVLHESLTDDVDELQQFLEFLESPEYKPGQTVPAKWEDRREHLMGRRHPDGRKFDVGRLLTQHHVELLRASPQWGEQAPELVDTPFVPAFHNARRADLILDQARKADILAVIARPEPLAPEEWLVRILKERPELSKRTLVVFNQLDTVDTLTLFGREGFAAAYEKASKALAQLGIPEENILVSCARLRFLELSIARSEDPSLPQRRDRLKAVLQRIDHLAAGRPQADFTGKLKLACDPQDNGIESLRTKLSGLCGGAVLRERLLSALSAMDEALLGAADAKVAELRANVDELRSQLRAL
ncbi:MAG TPA: hypothetical protein VGP72_17985 [Planctomycetota bacterium]